MAGTDELRKLLDERGVEWKSGNFIQPDAETQWGNNRYTDYPELPPFLTISNCTPEQAIAATLGNGECELIKHGYLANWPEMVCWSCSACGFGWHHSINDKQFSHCPNCGRRVKGGAE